MKWLQIEERKKGRGCFAGKTEACAVDRDSKIYLRVRLEGEAAAVPCNYCQEGETLLLVSRMREAGLVQAR